MRIVVEFCVQVITGTAGAVALRAAALDDEAGLHAVKREAVVKAGTGKLDERRAVRGCVVREKAKDDIALRRLDADTGGFRFSGERVNQRRRSC